MLETTQNVQIADFMIAIVAVVIAIAIFAAVGFYIKSRRNGSILGMKVRSNSRLAVLETVNVDQKRKLVLMSKDDHEFLMLIGGQIDVLVEASTALGLDGRMNSVSQPRSMETSMDQIIVASNDELAENPQTQRFVQNSNSPESDDQLSSELSSLLEDELSTSKIDEEVVAEAVNMLTSEEEVTEFFDRTRNRIFTQSPEKNGPREDTDDFSSILRAQQSTQKTAAPAMTERPSVSSENPAPASRLSQQRLSRKNIGNQMSTEEEKESPRGFQPSQALRSEIQTRAEERARNAATKARIGASQSLKIQPIPETPEERIEKLKSLLRSEGKANG